MREIRFYDLFGGVGGFRLGLEEAGRLDRRQDGKPFRDSPDPAGEEPRQEPSDWAHPRGSDSGSRLRCVGYCELDKHAVQIYNKNFGESHAPTDARSVAPESLPDFDLLCAGFPCQSFSMAGKRLGFQDTRGTLFFEIARIAKVKRPRLLLLENVKGLLSHDEGRTFGTILATLDELGYDAEWEVLNSKHFGVPQNRERVFVIGHLRGEPLREVFPLGQGPEVPTGTEPSERKVINTLAGGGHSGGHQTEMTLIQVGNLYETPHNSQAGRVYDTNGLAPNLKSEGGGLGGKVGLIKVYDDFNDAFTENVGSIRETFSREAPHNSVKLIQGERIRRLTPMECERLQGFPDGWTKYGIAPWPEIPHQPWTKPHKVVEISDTQRYKMMGNAVTVNVIQAIGERILQIDPKV